MKNEMNTTINQEEKTAFATFMDAENAIQPLDEVLTLLHLVFYDFNLGNTLLSDEEKFDLLLNYQKLGDMIMLASRTIENVIRDFYAINPIKKG